MFKKFFMLMAFCLIFSQTALARTIVFAVDATWPPMEFVNEDKEIVGYSIDYMKAAAKEAGFTPVFKNTAWDGIFAGLAGGNYDAICSSVSITPERKKAMDFSEPYFKVSQGLVVPKESKAKSLEDMKGKVVGAQIGTTGYFAVKKVPGVVAKSYDEIGLAMQDLLNGRIDGVVCDDPVAAQYALREPKFSEKLKIGAIIDSGDEYYGIAVKKGNKEVLDLINKGIRAVKAKGIEKQIKEKWFGSN
ncbi:basic amino acid ABC transporter substrate-binding protein [Desulfohalobiaceae bacterium Ax17]|jgi:polar amino acid transport system substrate-binding protein|uniref:basic amino acid ABC transporter substrate-binding protein n=1 Tax=Desulfovulcanus ferrireducens TaxID=2831190 RepID=UPI00207BADDA|nr:basic amino acid ABC transporter substrate-binding protein [Desulfovulcanus ferrireducens]MBT8763145.1 basic amino acid ABC transporter substrate-binding protein [Desulfovulcanus ferrireducens]